MTVIGFTGSRGENNAGMTAAQRRAFGRLLVELAATELHHGACVGADADAVRLARMIDVPCVARPGRSAKDAPDGPRPDRDADALAASGVILPEDTHFARNRAIVAACDVLIAAPAYPGPITPATKGGTAYTVTAARKAGRPVVILWPDGSTTHEQAGVTRAVNPDGSCTETWEA